MTKDGHMNPFRILIVGDSGTGKTSLLSRLTRNVFDLKCEPTNGMDLDTHEVLVNDKAIKIDMWDLAGGEKYRTLATSLFHDADGILLVYDISNAATFENVTPWLKNIAQLADPKTVVKLVGNKSDLEHRRVVSIEKAEELAADHGLSFTETSALDASNVKMVFQWMVEEMCAAMNSNSDDRRFSTSSFTSNTVTKENQVKGTPHSQDLSCNDTQQQQQQQQQQEEPFQIVLIDIKKAADYEIHCVKKPLLDDDDGDDLKYVAISYRWGELQQTAIDTKVGYAATISSFYLIDLYQLCQMMTREVDLKDIGYVWIDAICVNQANYEQRKATIHHMSTIYDRATYILAVPDLHQGHLRDTSTLYTDVLFGSQEYQYDLYHLIHGNVDQLADVEEAWLDECKVPNDPALRQLLKTTTDHFTKGLMTYCEHDHQYNAEDILNHLDDEYKRHLCQAAAKVAQIPTDDDDDDDDDDCHSSSHDDDDPFPDIKRLHHCHQVDCPLALSYTQQKKWKQDMIKKNGRYCNRSWQQWVQHRSTKIRQSLTLMADLIKGWSERVWVISEYTIAKRKNNMKYWFTQLSMMEAEEDNIIFFKFDFDTASAQAALLEHDLPSSPTFRAITNDPVYLTFHQTMLEQLSQQTFFEMMLKSKASKNDDRFYAVFPLTKYKNMIKNKAMVNSWKVGTLVSVRLVLFQVMDTKDKLNLLFFSGNRLADAMGDILPTFATSELNWYVAPMEHVTLTEWNVTQCNFDLTNHGGAITLCHSSSSSSKEQLDPYLNVKPMEYYIVMMEEKDEEQQEEAARTKPAVWPQLASEDTGPDVIVCIPSFIQTDMVAHWDDNDWNDHVIYLRGNFENNIWVLQPNGSYFATAPYFNGCTRHTSEDHPDGFNIY